MGAYLSVKNKKKLRSAAGPQQIGEGSEFYVNLCFDVIVEVFSCGNRSQLTKLERVGSRFHRIVEKFFEKKPFLHLRLELKPSVISRCKSNSFQFRFNAMFSHKLKPIDPIIIGNRRTVISLAYLAEFPKFLRFEEVKLSFVEGSQTIAEKCQLFDGCLQLIQAALTHSNEICFIGQIDESNLKHFCNHSTLVRYLRHGLLPICDSSRRYTFTIQFNSDKDAAANLIAEILRMPQIDGCSNVCIDLSDANPVHLPVESISNWLAGKSDDGLEIYGRTQQHKFIEIYSLPISDVLGLCDDLLERFNGTKAVKTPSIIRRVEFDSGDGIEIQTITNAGKTNKQLSLSIFMDWADVVVGIEIKRAPKKNNPN